MDVTRQAPRWALGGRRFKFADTAVQGSRQPPAAGIRSRNPRRGSALQQRNASRRQKPWHSAAPRRRLRPGLYGLGFHAAAIERTAADAIVFSPAARHLPIREDWLDATAGAGARARAADHRSASSSVGPAGRPLPAATNCWPTPAAATTSSPPSSSMRRDVPRRRAGGAAAARRDRVRQRRRRDERQRATTARRAPAPASSAMSTCAGRRVERGARGRTSSPAAAASAASATAPPGTPTRAVASSCSGAAARALLRRSLPRGLRASRRRSA